METQPVEIAEIAEIAEMPEIPEIAEIAEIAEMPEIPEIAEIAEIAEMPEITKVDDITKALKEKRLKDSYLNKANWNNLTILFNKIIYEFKSEIFGGAVVSLIFRAHWVDKYYAFIDTLQKEHPYFDKDNNVMYYDDSSFHPESYKGRTTFPKNDIDIFIKNEVNYKKFEDYLFKTFKIKKLKLNTNGKPNSPYFIETNDKLKKILTYHRFAISGYKMPLEITRLLQFLPSEDILNNILNNNIHIKLDIIILNDKWEEIGDYGLTYKDVSPPFNHPDFRCNQLTLTRLNYSKFDFRSDDDEDKQKEYTSTRNRTLRFDVRANWQVIPKIKSYETDYGTGILSNKFYEIDKQHNELYNLQIIIDDIIAQKAVAISYSHNPSSFIDYHRIIKMELK